MGAEKGHEKWGGREAGTPNRTTKKLREMISNFLIENFDTIKQDFNNLSAKERAKVYCDLLQYGVPKLQATSIDFNLERLSDEQLDKIIEELKNSANANPQREN